jgi:hypothetical protein
LLAQTKFSASRTNQEASEVLDPVELLDSDLDEESESGTPEKGSESGVPDEVESDSD